MRASKAAGVSTVVCPTKTDTLRLRMQSTLCKKVSPSSRIAPKTWCSPAPPVMSWIWATASSNSSCEELIVCNPKKGHSPLTTCQSEWQTPLAIVPFVDSCYHEYLKDADSGMRRSWKLRLSFTFLSIVQE